MSISKMKKLTVISPDGVADDILKRLIKLKCVEVRSAQGEEIGYLLRKMDCDDERSELQKKVAELENAIPELTKHSKRQGKLGDSRKKIDKDEFIACGAYEASWQVVRDVGRVLNSISECDQGMASNSDLIEALTPWRSYDVPMSLAETSKTKVIIGSLPSKTDMSALEAALGELYCNVHVASQDDSAIYVSLIVMNGDLSAVMQTLSPFGFVKISIAVQDTAKAEMARLKAENIELQKKKEELILQMDKLAESLDDVEVLYDIDKTSFIAVENKQKMARTENCAVLVGWVPEEREEKISATLSELCCAFDMREPELGEEPPVLLQNNSFAANFEWVVGMYSYPKYGSFDPTFIMSIFYFFMFGMMFADVGYGLLLALGGFFAPKIIGMSDNMKRSFNMFGYCGLSSIVMGVVFGGWFGDMPYAIMENMMGIENAREAVPFFNGIWFNPLDDPMAFLIVSLGVGAVHLVAGMAVKFFILCREGRIFSAIFDIASWWIIFGGIAVLVLVNTLAGWITVGIGIAMIVLTAGRHEKNIIMKFLKGLLGLYDVTSYASDLLSYSRILALGLAAGVIAQVVNLIGTMSGATVGGFIVFILACLVGHTLNLAINILGSFVHTSRLQYLEFFNKFYEDGGEQFKASEPSEKYTRD